MSKKKPVGLNDPRNPARVALEKSLNELKASVATPELFYEIDRDDDTGLRARLVIVVVVNPVASKETRKTALTDWMLASELTAMLNDPELISTLLHMDQKGQ